MPEQYAELKKIADRIEEIRIELFTSKEHRENLCFEDDFEHADENLFHVQSEIRDLVQFLEA